MPLSEKGARTGMLFIIALSFCAVGAAKPPDYPQTRELLRVENMHGVSISDPFHWLEDSADEAVRTWVADENALTRHTLDQFTTCREWLRQRYQQLYSANVASAPRVYGDDLFYRRRTGLQDHAVLYVRHGGLDQPAQVVFDPNELSENGTVALDWWYPSGDGKLVAYGTSPGGSEMSTLRVRDVARGVDLDLAIPNTAHAAVSWDPDGGGFTYTRYPQAGSVSPGDEHYYRHVYYHELGTSWEADQRLWGAGQAKDLWPVVYSSGDQRFQFLSIERGWTANDLYVRQFGEKGFQPLVVGLEALTDADVLGDQIYLRTNHEASRYRIVAMPVENGDPANWQEIVPEQKGVISEFVVADGVLVVHVTENAYSRLLIFEPDGKLLKEVELPALGTVSQVHGRAGRSELLFRFESFVYPPVVFLYDLRTHKMSVFDRLELGGGFKDVETEQVWFNSKDGTRVPMFVTHRKGLTLDGSHAAVLYGYGGFNISLTPEFDRSVIPWIESGGVWAVANIRGGGEFGQAWHMAGRLEHKQNAFDDFIAAAEKLVRDGYTRSDRLGIQGGSNGGLLMGAMIVQRPELFRAVHAAVPLMDMLRYHRFSVAELYTTEYGSPEDPQQFEFLRAYSPYHHVVKGTAYPAALLTTAEGDTRVDPMHARKMAARLQTATSSDRPILLWEEPQTGHTRAATPVSKLIDQEVDVWTFFIWQLGELDDMPATQPTTSPAAASP